MSGIRNIVFDFGKVLVDYSYERFVSSIVNDPAKVGPFVDIVSGQEFIDLQDRGELSFAEVIRKTQQEHPLWRDELQAYYDRQLEIVTGEVPGMKELIIKLKAEGYKIYGLSNWSSVVYDVMKRFEDIFSLLDGKVISSEEKLIKPDVAIYRRFCDKFGVEPQTCVFTDDKAPNIEGARKAGMHAILFQNADQFERQLRELL